MSKKLSKIPSKKLILDENLGYILGVIEGDGNIEWNIKTWVYVISLTVIDKDFALAFKKSLENWTGLKATIKCDLKEKNLTEVWLCSKIVAGYLKNFDLNKIKTASKKIKKMFLKGMFDSEGCVDFDIKYGTRVINITNNNKRLLQLCKDLLLDLNIESNKINIHSKKGTPYKAPSGGRGISNFDHYVLNMGKKESLVKFRDLIGFSIKRKQEKLVKLIGSYLTKEQGVFFNSLSPQKKKNWRKLYKEKFKKLQEVKDTER